MTATDRGSGSVRHAAIWAMGAQYGVFVAQFATSVIVSRYFLGPAEVGLFGIALAAAMLVAILQDFGITRYIQGEPELDATKIRTAYSISVVIAGGIGLVILALAWPVAAFYDDARLFPLLAIIASSYLLTPFGIVPLALLKRRMQYAQVFTVNIATALVVAATVLGLAALGYSAAALAWGTVAQAATRALLGQILSGTRFDARLNFRGARPIVGFGSQASVLYVTGGVGLRLPELIIGAMLGPTAVGLFGRAHGLSGALVQLVAGAIDQVFFPAFARMRDEGAPFAPAYLRVVAGFCSTCWPAVLFLAVAAEPLVLMLYGPVWAGVAPILVWIAVAEVLYSALPLHMDIPIVKGRIRTLIRYNLADTTAALVTLVIACFYSVEAAAIARLVHAFCWYGIYVRFMKQLVGFRVRELCDIYAKSAVTAVATIMPLLLVRASGTPAADIGFVELAGLAVAGCVAWLVAMKLVRHPNMAEIEDLARGLAKRLGQRSWRT